MPDPRDSGLVAHRLIVDGLDLGVSADRILPGSGWVAAWEGWPYSDRGLESSIQDLLTTGQSDLCGQFNLLVVDQASGRVLILRDLSGSYPLFFARNRLGFALASRISSLEQLLDEQFPLRLDRLRTIHQGGLDSLPRSLFHSVDLVPPDHVLTVSPDGSASTEANPYWVDRVAERLRQDMTEEGQLERCRSTLERSLAQATAETRSCFLVSGGLDSNLLLHAQSHRPSAAAPRALTLTFPGFDCDEFESAAFSCDRAGAELDALDLTETRSDIDVEALFGRCDVLPHPTTYLLVEAARRAALEGVDALIAGLGGDEIFSISIRRATVLTVRSGLLPALRQLGRAPRLVLGGRVRTMFDGRSAAIRALLHQSNAMFYLAAAQEAERLRVSLRSPLRDAAVIADVLPAACWSVLQNGTPRAFQRQLLERISPGLTRRVGARKATFEEFADPLPRRSEELGEPFSETLAAVVPAFLAAHRALGMSVVDHGSTGDRRRSDPAT